MATVEKRTWDRNETQRRIRHPLQAVSGYIRRYVVLEGTAVALLFLAACFWIWLAIDFGTFSLLGVDGVKWLDRTFPANTAFFIRAFVLGLLIVGLIAVVAFKVLGRLFSEFSDGALALVLERRFPNELGDRLITAVEMADPKLAEKYGHSQEMVDFTIRHAAERVAKVPVAEVFNWGRLTRQWLLVALLTVGVYLLLFLGFGTYLALTESSAGDYFWRFNRTAAIWGKRNALLMNRVYWPTRSYVEFVRFQAAQTKDDGITEVMKVARDEKRPDIEVRAFQWVVYDTSAADSIRPLKLSDLKGWLDDGDLDLAVPESWPHWIMDTDDIDLAVPNALIPEHWNGKSAGKIRQELDDPILAQILTKAGVLQKFRDWLNWKTWTVDQLQAQLERKEGKAAQKIDDNAASSKSSADNKTVGQKLRAEHGAALAKLEALVGPGGKLETLAESPSSNWDIRKLTLPAQVHVAYFGKQTRSYRTFASQDENRFSVSLSELKESVTLFIHAEDFHALPKEIQLVPPPQFTQLMINLREPAYKYYRLQSQQELLQQAKQTSSRPMSLTGPTSQYDILVGTDIELVATIERELKEGILIAPLQEATPRKIKDKPGLLPGAAVKLHADKKTFSLALPDVQASYEFELHFVDLDNVKGSRHIVLRAVPDQKPEEIARLSLNAPLRIPTTTNEEGVTIPTPGLTGFLITPDALVPFKGIMRDDIGLTKMQWTYDYKETQFSLFRTEADTAKDAKDELRKKLQNAFRNQAIATGFQGLPLDLAQGLAAPAYWQMISDLIERDIELAAKEIKKIELIDGQPVMMTNFGLKLADIDKSKAALHPGDFLDKLKKNQLVGDPPAQPLLKEYDVFREDGFDVARNLGQIFKPKSGDVQKHYILRVWMQATDNNLKSGVTKSEKPVAFLVITPVELRALIMLQEDKIRTELEKVRDKLDKDVRVTLNDQIDKLKYKGGKDDPALDLTLIRLRMDADVRKHVEKSTKVVTQSLTDYVKIKQEWEVNNMELHYKGYHKRINNSIIAPLEDLTMLKTGEVATALDAVSRAQAELELDEELHKDELGKPKNVDDAIRLKHVKKLQEAQVELDKLITKMTDIIDAIGGGFGKAQAEALLAALIEDQERQTGELKAMHKKVYDDFLQALGGGK